MKICFLGQTSCRQDAESEHFINATLQRVAKSIGVRAMMRLPFFQFSGDIRRIMYTTNIIEGLNSQYRKVTKTKSVFPSDSALEKMLYLASENVAANGLRDTGTGIRY